MLSKKHEHGIALVMVLWISVLLSVIAGSYAMTSRTENMQARYLFDNTHARYAAQVGVHLAVYQAFHPQKEHRWLRDGRPYQVSFGESTLEIRLQDEAGKIDLNKAKGAQLSLAFTALGLDEEKADEVVGAVLDWRDKDQLLHLNGAEDLDYEAAGYPYGAKDAPFDMVEELQQLMGMDYALYQKLAPALTVYASQPKPVIALAPREVLLTIPEVDAEFVDAFIEQREQLNTPGEPLLALPNGVTPVVTANASSTLTITSRAELANGAWTIVEATVQPNHRPTQAPFRVLRWKEGIL